MFKNAYQLSTQRPLRRHKQWGNPLDKSEKERLLRFSPAEAQESMRGGGFLF